MRDGAASVDAGTDVVLSSPVATKSAVVVVAVVGS